MHTESLPGTHLTTGAPVALCDQYSPRMKYETRVYAKIPCVARRNTVMPPS